MSDGDLMFQSAIELASMVRSGEVSARELVQCSLDRIEELTMKRVMSRPGLLLPLLLPLSGLCL